MSDGSSSTGPQRSPRVPSSNEEKLLRAVERAIARSYAAKQAAKPAEATANVSPWRRLFRKVIKEIKSMLGLSLVDSKKFVESAPKMMKEGVPKEEAEKIVETLKALGATVVME